MADAIQSHWASLAAAAGFNATPAAFGPVALAAAREEAVFFFFPMALGTSSRIQNLGAVAMGGRKQGRR
jgi:hypothetical protein